MSQVYVLAMPWHGQQRMRNTRHMLLTLTAGQVACEDVKLQPKAAICQGVRAMRVNAWGRRRVGVHLQRVFTLGP